MRETHTVGAQTREWIVGRSCTALAEAGMPLAGVSDATRPFAFARRRPSIGQVLVCFEGRGEVWTGGQWRTCSRGMAYLTPAGVPHAYRAVRASRWKLCWVHIEPGAAALCEMPVTPLLRRLDPRPLRAAVLGLYRESIGPADPLHLRAWVDLLRLAVLRAARPQRDADRLWSLWETIGSDLAHHWSVDEMAELAGMSDEHLRRICKSTLGRSPIEQVTELRMRRAAALLESSRLKIETIAAAVGYGDRFSFSVAFRRCVGSSPAAFRKLSASANPAGRL